MKSEIVILSYVKYNSKKDNKPKTKVQFAFGDKQDTEKFKGVSVLDCFYDGHEVFNKLNANLILKRVQAEFEIQNDLYDPLACKKILKKIDNIELY